MRRKVYLVGLDGMMYPMYKRFSEEGVLPHLTELAENGMVTEVYSCLPAYTPTNWASMITGALPGTHSILRWYVDLPSPKNTEMSVNAFISNANKAETIFEAAARAGLKSVAFHYPGTSPRRTESLYSVDGFANPAQGATPYEVTPSLTYTNVSKVPRAYQVALAPADNWVNLPPSKKQPLQFPILVVTKQEGENRLFHGCVVAEEGNDYDTVIICRKQDGDTRIASSRVGSWSDWCRESFVITGKSKEAMFRFKTVELTPDAKQIRLYRSQAVALDEFCEPPQLGRELTEKFGPYLEHASLVPNTMRQVDLDTCLEEMEYQSQWVAHAGRYMLDEKDCHLFYCHIHTFDYVNHTHLSGVDPASPGYDPDTAEEHWDVYRRCYMQADRMIATIMNGLDDNSCILVASDHAAVPDRRAINMRKFLCEKGFLALKDPANGLDRDETPNGNIDWSKTKAYMKPGLGYDIFVNAPEGSSEYINIQNDLIRVLRTWVDKDTNMCPVAIALRKKDAPLLGFWGEQCGDVVFVNEDGYAHGYMGEWGEIKGGGYVGAPGHYGAHHGPQLPTSKTEISSNLAFLLAHGPGIKKGYQRPTKELGYIHMTSVVPLICHLLDIEPPAQCQGHVPTDILEGKSAVMERLTDYPEWESGTRRAGWGERIQVQKNMFDFQVYSKENQ